MSRIAVAMSGGVDSSVAACLLRERGEDVIGLAMQLVDRRRGGPSAASRCCGPRDLLDARAAAERIGIPFYVVNMEEEFHADVIAPFAAAYRAGRTPVPCADCNNGPKFTHLLERALALGADRLATGHYARRGRDAAGGLRLLAARDRRRDQSYFLHGLTPFQLEHVLFPLGEMTKDEVRTVAAARGLPNAAKPDSQDLCFVPDGGYLAIVRRESADAGPAGAIVSTRGEVLGRHDGIAAFTIGQRRGLGLGGGRPYYVVDIDPDSGRVTVGEGHEQMRSSLLAERVTFVDGTAPPVPFAAVARIRSSHAGAACRVRPLRGGRIAVRFAEPQRAITPGQAVVLYDGDVVLGGGTITRPRRRPAAGFDTRANAMLQSRPEGRA